MSMASVSVIIPAYRAARTIGRALDSVLTQTVLPREILVIDDGSPDDLARVVRQYEGRVQYLHKTNGGAASARNFGIDGSRGDFVAFLDSDDYWEPQKLERQLLAFEEHPEIGVACSRWYIEEPGAAREAPDSPVRHECDRVMKLEGKEAFDFATKMWTSSIIVRRTVLGEHRFIPGLEPAEDRDLWVRLVQAAPVYKFADPLATYVQEPGSLSRTHVDRDYGNMLRVVHRHRDVLGRSGVRHWETETYRRWAARHLGNGHARAALRPAWKRLLRDPLSFESWRILLKTGLKACPG